MSIYETQGDSLKKLYGERSEYLVVLLMYMREEDSEMGTIIVSMANFVLWEIRVSTMQLQ